MNEKVPLTTSNRRKRELAKEEDLVTYKRKRKTIDPSTVAPPNTVDSANEGISDALPPTESAKSVNIPQGLEFETESAQACLGAQPPLPNVSPDFDVNIPIIGGYSKGEGATSNDNITPTLDDVEQLVELPVDGDATVIGGTWGFLAILETFVNSLLQDLNAFMSLKAGGTGNSLSLKKLKEHYAYKLEKFSVTGTDVSARYLILFAKDKVAKKWSWGSAVLTQMYYNLGAASRDDGRQFVYCTTLLDDSGIHQRKPVCVNEHGDTPVHQSEDIAEQYDASHHEYASLSLNINLNDQQITILNDQLQKHKEDKEKEFKVNINLKEALKEKCKEIKSLKAVNAILMEQIDMQLPPSTLLAVLQSHQPMPDTTLAKKYEDLLAAHEDAKKKLIAKEDFISHSK
ncbi:hypothetical protein GIB67_016660 [Kingdonia uniflora]|uniref:Uncharacterized protein n=1 Tax=Kingdonia uniflora TaxID=39325 RepID=A0A7J7MZI2_9MAGN|nr:hypothetical protein GIB67_016660 [Kingdonia uniflora]